MTMSTWPLCDAKRIPFLSFLNFITIFREKKVTLANKQNSKCAMDVNILAKEDGQGMCYPPVTLCRRLKAGSIFL